MICSTRHEFHLAEWAFILIKKQLITYITFMTPSQQYDSCQDDRYYSSQGSQLGKANGYFPPSTTYITLSRIGKLAKREEASRSEFVCFLHVLLKGVMLSVIEP